MKGADPEPTEYNMSLSIESIELWIRPPSAQCVRKCSLEQGNFSAFIIFFITFVSNHVLYLFLSKRRSDVLPAIWRIIIVSEMQPFS